VQAPDEAFEAGMKMLMECATPETLLGDDPISDLVSVQFNNNVTLKAKPRHCATHCASSGTSAWERCVASLGVHSSR
jgi:hypothetical protein